MEIDALWQIFTLSYSNNWQKLCLLSELIWDGSEYQKWQKTLIAMREEKYTSFEIAPAKELIELLQNKGKLLNWYDIYHLCKYGRNEVLYKILNHDLPNSAKVAFQHGARFNRLSLLKWIHKNFNINDADACDTFRVTIYENVFDAAKWLVETFDIPQWFATNYSNRVFVTLASNGHLEFLQWATEHFEFTKTEATFDNYTALELIARNGHLEMLKWIVRRFNITRTDITIDKNKIIREAAKYNNMEMIRWIMDRFEL